MCDTLERPLFNVEALLILLQHAVNIHRASLRQQTQGMLRAVVSEPAVPCAVFDMSVTRSQHRAGVEPAGLSPPWAPLALGPLSPCPLLVWGPGAVWPVWLCSSWNSFGVFSQCPVQWHIQGWDGPGEGTRLGPHMFRDRRLCPFSPRDRGFV